MKAEYLSIIMHSLSYQTITHYDTNILFNYTFYEWHLQVPEGINWSKVKMMCGNTSSVIGLSYFNKHGHPLFRECSNYEILSKERQTF
ncbi:MAG: hypothetical protein ACC651_08170 [Candidatus Scalindua sp.]